MSDNEVVYNSDLEECVERNLQWTVKDEDDEIDEESWNYAVFSVLQKTSLVKVVGGLLLFGSGIVVGAASNALMIDYGSIDVNDIERRRMPAKPKSPPKPGAGKADSPEKKDAAATPSPTTHAPSSPTTHAPSSPKRL